MSVLSTVKLIAPAQTDGMNDSDIEAFILLASARMHPEVWGTRLYPQGLAYLTAHLLTMARRGAAGGGTGAAGPVKQEMAGRVLISYSDTASAGGGQHELAQTPYGNEFLALRKKLPGTRSFTTGFTAEEVDGRGVQD